MDYTNDTTMLRKVTELMDKLEKNSQMQQLAYENGIDTKNSVRLTAATKENIAVSVIALMLAKQDNDPRYRDLVRYGMDHRQTKAGIINDYKNQANALITKYRNGERPETVEIVKIETESYDGYGDRWLDADIPDIYNEQAYTSWSNRIIQEGVGKVIGAIVLLPLVLVGKAIALVISLIDKFIGLFTRISPQRLLKKLESLPEEKREWFSLTVKADNKDDMKLLRLQSDGYIMLTEAFSAFCDSVESLIENGVDEKRIMNEIDKLVAKADELLTDESIKMPSLGENSGTLTYDETVDLLKDLCRFDMKKCRNVSSRLQRILSKIKTVSKEEKEKNGGLTDSDVTKLQVGVAYITSKIQSWTKMRDRLLKKADITFNGYAAAHHDAYNERKNELENHTMRVATEQYEGYGEDLMALDIPYTSELYSESYFESVIQEGAGGVGAAIGIGVGALLAFIITLPFLIVVWVCKLIVGLFQAIIGLFKKTTPEKLIAKLEKLSPEDKEMFLLNTKGIDIPKLLILMPIQKLIDDWTELANNSDIAQRKSWEDFENKIKNIVAMSKRNENFSWLQNNVRNYAENVQLNYQATIDVLNMLKNIDVNKLRDLVKKYNKIIAEKTRELKQLENEHKNDNTPSTAEQRRNAEYIQKVSNDFVNLVRDTYNTAMTIMRTTSTTIYSHFGDDPHDGWYQTDSPNISKTKGLSPYAKAGFDMLHSI